MKTINTIRLLAALLAAVLLCSCTQNNGHIGKLFGTWVLTERLADGAAIEKPYDADAYMSFQNNIVHFRTVENNYDLIEYKTATWIRMGDSLSFDFDNTSDAGNPDIYSAPAWLEPVGTDVVMNINRLDGAHLELMRTASDGVIYIYKFDKTW